MATPAKHPDFSLIETLRRDRDTGFVRLERHLDRLEKSADHLGFPGAENARAALMGINRSEHDLRVRLEFFGDGRISLTTAPYAALPETTVWRVAIASTRLASTDAILRHKTSLRQHYAAARAEFDPALIDEVLLLNEKGQLCEGTITSLFVPDDDQMLLTPPLECGLLAGVLRAELLETGKARCVELTPEDLAGRTFFLGNSLRGLIQARLDPKVGSAP